MACKPFVWHHILATGSWFDFEYRDCQVWPSLSWQQSRKHWTVNTIVAQDRIEEVYQSCWSEQMLPIYHARLQRERTKARIYHKLKYQLQTAVNPRDRNIWQAAEVKVNFRSRPANIQVDTEVFNTTLLQTLNFEFLCNFELHWEVLAYTHTHIRLSRVSILKWLMTSKSVNSWLFTLCVSDTLTKIWHKQQAADAELFLSI